MTLVDGLIVLAILVAFVFLIITQIRKKNPKTSENIKSWFSEKPKILNTENIKGKMEQIYPQRRWGV
jgi:uncharacterized membrane protein YgaE (UPF0421/DUF939 family)